MNKRKVCLLIVNKPSLSCTSVISSYREKFHSHVQPCIFVPKVYVPTYRIIGTFIIHIKITSCFFFLIPYDTPPTRLPCDATRPVSLVTIIFNTSTVTRDFFLLLQKNCSFFLKRYFVIRWVRTIGFRNRHITNTTCHHNTYSVYSLVIRVTAGGYFLALKPGALL